MAISRIYEVKQGPFFEHSSQLYNIATGVQLWSKVNSGLFKMYEVSVCRARRIRYGVDCISPGRGAREEGCRAAHPAWRFTGMGPFTHTNFPSTAISRISRRSFSTRDCRALGFQCSAKDRRVFQHTSRPYSRSISNFHTSDLHRIFACNASPRSFKVQRCTHTTHGANYPK